MRRPLAVIAATLALAAGGCDLTAGGEPLDAGSDAGDAGYPPPNDGVVPPVGSAATFDIACWNIENFPASPATPGIVADLITSLDLDAVMIEEVADVAAWNELVARLPRYRAVLSEHRYTPTSYQKLGFLYRPDAVVVGEPELLFVTDPTGFPRPPLRVPLTVGGLALDVIGIHLKAGTAPDDAARRAAAARTLDAYLRAQVAGAGDDEVIVLGDYNETLDGSGATVLAPLLAGDLYRFRDAASVAAGNATFLPARVAIDHLLTTAGLDDEIGPAQAVVPRLDQQYPRYEVLVSDHLPVVLSIPQPAP